MTDPNSPRPRKLFRLSTTRASIQHEIDDELRFHLDARADALVRLGHSSDDARRIALNEYGDIAAARAQLAQIDRRRLGRTALREWFSSLEQDLKFGLRGLRARPAFAATVILTLALGIGANAAIFSVVDAVLLQPLPFAHPERLVHLWEVYHSNVDSRSEASYPDYLDWRARNHSFSDLGGYNGSGFLLGEEHPVLVGGAKSTSNFFDVLGVHAALGRTFAAGEDAPAAPRVAVLSYGFWERQFARDASVIGRAVTIDGAPATIVGVLPESFEFAREGQADIWMPIDRGTEARQQRGNHWLNIVARLADGTTPAAASADMSRIMRDLARENPETNTGRDGQVVALRDELVGSVRPLILVLYGAVAVMLLVACANVANLLLMRAADREREIAVRVALGAGRARLVRQLLTESMVLAVVGGLLGVLLARGATHALVAAVPSEVRTTIPALATVGVDARVVAYACAVSVFAGLLFGVVPALRTSRSRAYDALRDGARGSSTGRSVRDLLVVAEVALTIVLMSGAALFGRSLMKLLSVHLGFAAEHVITAGVLLPGASYSKAPERIDFYNRLIPAVHALPGVESVGLVTKLPLEWGNSVGFDIAGRAPAPPGQGPTASYRDASPDYFATLRIPMIAGRTFSDGDGPGAPLVGVVNSAFANAYFPGVDPVGQSLDFWKTHVRIVGVVGDVPIGKLEDKIPPTLYVPLAQDAETFMRLAVRTSGDPAAIGGSLAQVVAKLDPRAALLQPVTMDDLLTRSTSVFMRRFPLLLVGVFALTTLLLALVGIYGVVSYSVANRTRELGIRLALGAQPRNVVTLVVRHGAWMAAAGVIVGVFTTLMLGRFVSGLLYGVSARDPISFEIVALLLGGSAILATLLPARRASRVDPASALRAD